MFQPLISASERLWPDDPLEDCCGEADSLGEDPPDDGTSRGERSSDDLDTGVRSGVGDSLVGCVDVEVPVTVIGEAAPGTIHMIEAATVMVSAPAVSVPEAIEVDVTGVAAGTVLTLADIALPKGVEAVADAETAVVNVANEHAVASEVTEDAPAEAAAEAEAE